MSEVTGISRTSRVYFRKSKLRKAANIVIYGNCYGINNKRFDRTEWICTEYRKTKCKARVTTMKNMAILTNTHNHTPNCVDKDFESLPSQVVRIQHRMSTV
nr:unnamed protein product [Callosobruchus chinensis]